MLQLREEDTPAVFGLTQFVEKVEAFHHNITGRPMPEIPHMLTGVTLEHAVECFREEIEELLQAKNVEEQADAIVDLMYFAAGRLLEMGVHPDRIMEEVHRANMAKVRGAVDKRPNSQGHDAVKPPGWVPPDHSWLSHITPSLVSVLRLRTTKAQDYNNGGVSLRDYFPFGLTSYVQMLFTKVMRLVSLVKSGREHNATHESSRSTIADLANYSLYCLEQVDDWIAEGQTFHGDEEDGVTRT